MRNRVLHLLPSWLLVAGVLAAAPEEMETLSAAQTSAVIFRDDFNGKTWGDIWRGDWIQDKNIQVRCKDGKLHISGTTGAPVQVCRDHHEFRFCGLVSKNTIERDVVVACKMRVRAPLPEGDKRVRYLVHLCGARPDYFVDTGLAHEPDGREGWLHVPIAEGYPFSHDHNYPFVPLEIIPPYAEHTIVIEHQASTRMTRAHVVHEDTWHSLGEHRVYLSTTQIELKVDVPYNDVEVDVTYDDLRMYPRPETGSVRFVLIKPPFPGFPFPKATITFLDERGETVAEGETDRDGEASLLFPRDRLYPMGGTVVVSHKGDTVGRVKINASGVHGLYPGDVWKIDAPEKFKVTGKGYPLGM